MTELFWLVVLNVLLFLAVVALLFAVGSLRDRVAALEDARKQTMRLPST